MARKIIGYYNDVHDTENRQLILEIGHDQVACLVKSSDDQVTGFEVFALEKKTGDWSDTFYEVRSASDLLNNTYRETHCYYNFEEALVMPQLAFNTTAATDYLALVYGESERHEVRNDLLKAPGKMVNAYRVKRSVHELVGRHFVLYRPHHIYSAIIDRMFEKLPPVPFIKIQFYSTHIILAFIENEKLQLVQSFTYKAGDDILYYVLTVIQQFGISATDSILEISGMFDKETALYQQFLKLFGQIQFDELAPDVPVASALAEYPAYYFTPFYNLSA